MRSDSEAPPAADGIHGLDRRSFLKISGAGVAGALLASSLSPARTLAQGSDRSELMREFTEAAKEYDVPVGLLMAMGYVNTRWEMPPPELSAYEDGDPHGWGGYGMMALVKNPSTDTLGDASRLTGISEEKLKTDRKSNIMGGAALLAESQGESKPRQTGKWFQALAGRGAGNTRRSSSASEVKDFDAPAGVGGKDLYAEQVFETLRNGAAGVINGGERLSLSPDKGA